MANEQEEQKAAREGKLKALQAAMSKIEKDFGKGSIMKLGEEKITKQHVDIYLLEVSTCCII